MKTSEYVDQLFTDLAKAQGEFGPLEKDREVTVTMKSGGKYTFEYATLDSCLKTVRKPLADHGLCLVQPSRIENGHVVVATRLGHASGQWLEEEFAFSTEAVAPQDLGGLVTYARRYSLCSMLSLAAEEDDDANAASGNQREIIQRRSHAVPPKTNGHKPPPKKSAAEMTAELKDRFDGNDPSIAIMDKARKVIAAAVTDQLVDACDRTITARADNNEINAMQCAELSELLSHRKRENEANKDLQAAATS